MTKMRMVISCCITMALFVVALTIPAIVEAGTIKIWPDQLKPLYPNNPYQQSPYSVCNSTFTAPIILPLGAKITNITYYHIGQGSPASTDVTVVRFKMGNYTTEIGRQWSTDSTGWLIAVNVPITGDPIIRAGYRYYLYVQAINANSYFLGAKITYQE